MKKILTLLMATVMLVALAACGTTAPAEEEANTDETDKVLRVAMECAYAPYNWNQPTDENGAVPISGTTSEYAYGYDVMMAKLIAEKLDYELEIVMLNWDSIIPAVQTGTVDVAICGQSITSDRLELVDFTEPYYYASIVTLVQADGEYANATSVADLAGTTVTSQLNTIWDMVCVPQIPDVNAMPGQKSAPAMIVALTSGRVDAVVTDQPTGLAAVSANEDIKMLEFEGENGYVVSDEDINIGISLQKGNTELLEAINAILVDMTEDDFKAMMNDAIAVQPLSE